MKNWHVKGIKPIYTTHHSIYRTMYSQGKYATALLSAANQTTLKSRHIDNVPLKDCSSSSRSYGIKCRYVYLETKWFGNYIRWCRIYTKQHWKVDLHLRLSKVLWQELLSEMGLGPFPISLHLQINSVNCQREEHKICSIYISALIFMCLNTIYSESKPDRLGKPGVANKCKNDNWPCVLLAKIFSWELRIEPCFDFKLSHCIVYQMYIRTNIWRKKMLYVVLCADKIRRIPPKISI